LHTWQRDPVCQARKKFEDLFDRHARRLNESDRKNKFIAKEFELHAKKVNNYIEKVNNFVEKVDDHEASIATLEALAKRVSK
jgi:pyocin large subunit-like protein